MGAKQTLLAKKDTIVVPAFRMIDMVEDLSHIKIDSNIEYMHFKKRLFVIIESHAEN